MTTRGLKRLCGSCGTKFYDFGKLPIICPSCGAEFTGEVVIKTRRKSTIVADTVKRDEVEKKNAEAAEDDETISLDEAAEEEEIDEIDPELAVDDDIDDVESDDDLSDLEGDVDIAVDMDDDK